MHVPRSLAKTDVPQLGIRYVQFVGMGQALHTMTEWGLVVAWLALFPGSHIPSFHCFSRYKLRVREPGNNASLVVTAQWSEHWQLKQGVKFPVTTSFFSFILSNVCIFGSCLADYYQPVRSLSDSPYLLNLSCCSLLAFNSGKNFSNSSLFFASRDLDKRGSGERRHCTGERKAVAKTTELVAALGSSLC